MNAFVVRGLYVNFYFDSLKIFVFVDAHGSRVYEDTINASLCFILLLSTSALNIAAPITVNTDNIEL